MAKKVTQYENQQGVITSVKKTTFSGPLPAPSDLAAYKEIMQDAPERIMVMAEKEQKHRHTIEQKIVNNGSRESLIGQFLAFIIAFSFLIAAVYLAMNGHEVVAVSLIGIIAALATIFYFKKEPTK